MESAPNYAKKDDPRAVAWLKRYDALKSERAEWESVWQEIGDYMLPDKAGILSSSSGPDVARHARLFDTSGQDAAIQCAAGLLSWRTPANEPWFAWGPPRQLAQSDATKQWLQDCSSLAREYLANSNFYTETHDDMLNHCTFCTSALYVSMQGGKTVFKSLPIGSYVIAENYLGLVDTLYREFELTARQAKQQFGTDKLGRDVPLPECIEKVLKGDNKNEDKRFTFVHVVEPRPAKDRGDGVGLSADWQKPVLSAYIEKESRSIVQESGFDSFPYMVGRWMKAQIRGTETSVWGVGPGFSALPEARQLNFTAKMIDVYAEKGAFPPMLIPDSLEGELNFSARGQNYYEPSVDPRGIIPLNVTGDYQMLDIVSQRRKAAIEMKFHVPFFQMFRGIDPKITATLTRELAAERYTAIHPALTRLIYEKDTPMLMRCFDMWAAAGMLPPPPEEAVMESGKNGVTVPNPQVTYTSRLALAERSMKNLHFDRSFARVMQMAEVDPTVFDNINTPIMIRDSMRNDGVPADWIRPLEEVAQMQAQRAEMQQAQQQMAMLKDAGAAAGGLAKAATPEVRELIGV
jgi:hypothetical protein